jgi:hypothetical protein
LRVVTLGLTVLVSAACREPSGEQPDYTAVLKAGLASISSGPVRFTLTVEVPGTYYARATGTTDLTRGRSRMSIDGDTGHLERIDAPGVVYVHDSHAPKVARYWQVRPAVEASPAASDDVLGTEFVAASPTPLLGIAWGFSQLAASAHASPDSGVTTMSGRVDLALAAKSAPRALRHDLAALLRAEPSLTDARLSFDSAQRLIEFQFVAEDIPFVRGRDDISLHFTIVGFHAETIDAPNPSTVEPSHP